MSKLLLLIATIIGVSLAIRSNQNLDKWEHFKQKFGKTYTSQEEERHRLQAFMASVERAEKMNQKDKHATYGITKFSDMTPEEFKNTILMKNITVKKDKVPQLLQKEKVTLPSSFDWKDKGMVTPVKDQGQCGSCWDFSATETIESVCALAGYPLDTLSEQQILDCDTVDGGCDGGWPYDAYQYVISAGGLETEADYPYSAQDGQCQFNHAEIECPVTKWEYVTQSQDENAMQSFLYSNSPLSVCVDAETWQDYTAGVITPDSGCGDSIDHCVQITGWQQMDGMKVWNVRNSWGTNWGMNGYLYVEIGSDVCAIAEVVTVPCVQSKTTGKLVC